MHVRSTLSALEEGGRWACLQTSNYAVIVHKVSAPLPFPPPPPALHLFTTSCPVFFYPICFVLSRPRPAPAACSLLLGGVVLSEESLQSEFCKLEHLLHRARRAAVFHCLLCLGFLERGGTERSSQPRGHDPGVHSCADVHILYSAGAISSPEMTLNSRQIGVLGMASRL